MIFELIVGCEVGFWAFLLTGLGVRYLLRLPRVGAAFLLCVPAVDLVLFVATIIDLRSGGAVGQADGLAALYIGYSVTFGSITIRWADERFHHRFAGGPRPKQLPGGSSRTRYEWRLWFRLVLGGLMSCALLFGGVFIVGDATRAASLFGWMARVVLILVIALIWPVSYSIWPAKSKTDE